MPADNPLYLKSSSSAYACCHAEVFAGAIGTIVSWVGLPSGVTLTVRGSTLLFCYCIICSAKITCTNCKVCSFGANQHENFTVRINPSEVSLIPQGHPWHPGVLMDVAWLSLLRRHCCLPHSCSDVPTNFFQDGGPNGSQ